MCGVSTSKMNYYSNITAGLPDSRMCGSALRRLSAEDRSEGPGLQSTGHAARPTPAQTSGVSAVPTGCCHATVLLAEL